MLPPTLIPTLPPLFICPPRKHPENKKTINNTKTNNLNFFIFDSFMIDFVFYNN
jgi:hypothetical protein